ncbi:hypothetical protein NQ176_g5910 [Zarea fungicola]|uniref:Uncharacterized protein n=1 Tax=Zarea fungicola TaxID=93591 RepID=A0ACC1N6U0_9HYPO|nr:hypothetical protein NQ176_g5910 [Lecanicillium fungicola]
MAEVFGIVSGALSVASLFNNCVDCFEYIQLGRHFGSDFERYQLEAFVRVVRAVDAGDAAAAETFQPWVSLDESKAVMEVVDAIYDKAGLQRRQSAEQSTSAAAAATN